MKFFRIDLLTLLISLFILSGCKSESGIGLDPENKLNGSLYIDTNIVVTTVKEDTIVTSGSSGTKLPLAFVNDNELGTTRSNLAMSIGLPGGVAYTVPTGNISIDSAVLVLRYADGFYGDSLTTKYKANVYQVTERPQSTRTYYNSKVWTGGTFLGSATVNARTRTSIKITDIVTGGKDTLKTVGPQMRVRLDTGFIAQNFLRLAPATLASNTLFQNFFKGLFVTLDSTQVNGTGGALMMAMDSCRIDVYYRNNNAGTIDTSIVSLPITQRAANIRHDYSKKPAVVAALANQTSSASTFYVQSLGGLRAKVSFPKLKDLMTQAGGEVVINRAELVISPTPGTTVPLQPLPKISMYQLDIARQRVALQDASQFDKRYLGVSVFGGYYTSTNDYHFIVTGYVEDLLRGKTVDYGTYIGAVDNVTGQTVAYQPTVQTAGRLIAVGTTGKTTANYPYRIKLNIIYTKVNNVK